MATFVINDTHLERLSPAARRELLRVLGAELSALRERFYEPAWDPEGSESYPLDAEEAVMLLQGMPESAIAILRVFAGRGENGGEVHASFRELLEAAGHTKFENLNRQLSWIMLHLRAVTGNPDAWLINWRARDWNWDERQQTWTEGSYFVTAAAASALRDALSKA